jgi:hypothetical protein
MSRALYSAQCFPQFLPMGNACAHTSGSIERCTTARLTTWRCRAGASILSLQATNVVLFAPPRMSAAVGYFARALNVPRLPNGARARAKPRPKDPREFSPKKHPMPCG